MFLVFCLSFRFVLLRASGQQYGGLGKSTSEAGYSYSLLESIDRGMSHAPHTTGPEHDVLMLFLSANEHATKTNA